MSNKEYHRAMGLLVNASRTTPPLREAVATVGARVAELEGQMRPIPEKIRELLEEAAWNVERGASHPELAAEIERVLAAAGKGDEDTSATPRQPPTPEHELMTEPVIIHKLRAAHEEVDALHQQVADLEAALHRTDCARLQAEEAAAAVLALINDSDGVAGLHLNGGLATWGELTRGRFSAWLEPLAAWQAERVDSA